MTQAAQEILTERGDGVLTLRINRPEKKNALTRAMYLSMKEALLAVEGDDDIGAVLITGTPDCFTAGNDLKDFQDRAVDTSPPPSAGLDLIRTMAAFPKPIVAAVNGVAVGIGTTLLLHCDFVYAGRNARLHTPFVDLGLTPEAASSLLLPATVGPRRTAELLMLGDPMDGKTAQAADLVTAALDDDQVESHAREVAVRLAAKPRQAMRQSKALMKRGLHGAVMETIDHESGVFAERLRSGECQEIIGRFLGKTAPSGN